MSSDIALFLAVFLLLINSSIQQLNKQPLFSGLGDLDFSFLKASPRLSFHIGANKSLCDCNGADPQSAQTVRYFHQWIVLCICPNAVMNADYMIDMMGKVPYAIRRYNKAMLSATEGACGGAGSSGDISFYCDKDMHVTVFIHESAHSFDRGKSNSDEWRDAVAKDTCVPDAYANTNYAENFAQVVVVWVHLAGQKRDKDLGGIQFACMNNQLKLMAQYMSNHYSKN